MAVSSESVISPGLNDPVTKAVVDNIMGNLPTKKPPVRCDDCDLSFTSQTVLDTHLQGARHAKQIRSKNIMASLEETKVAFTKDEETNGLKCNVCNVCLNSIQQLQTHLNGILQRSRHKKKAMRGGWTDKDVGSSVTSATMNIQENTVSKGVSLSCSMCNKIFNSQMQYNVHITSKKHTGKLKQARTQKKKRFLPYWKKPKPGVNPKNFVQSLSNNFVPGGFTNQT
ncbi:zinc finger protein 346-like isoform X1 [Bombus huntii]|uniref:zinc finger protein 346-like isoform X1 n=1 Tax=Bombus huntii TaxID=85661 RepID=UPI0021AA16C6|nr:zinc finger protein 346-like isoform X1 [Bombus huntii]XP_050472650.1 zinc finger protein 346-like isoform X1 [Bombus huntii]